MTFILSPTLLVGADAYGSETRSPEAPRALHHPEPSGHDEPPSRESAMTLDIGWNGDAQLHIAMMGDAMNKSIHLDLSVSGARPRPCVAPSLIIDGIHRVRLGELKRVERTDDLFAVHGDVKMSVLDVLAKIRRSAVVAMCGRRWSIPTDGLRVLNDFARSLYREPPDELAWEWQQVAACGVAVELPVRATTVQFRGAAGTGMAKSTSVVFEADGGQETLSLTCGREVFVEVDGKQNLVHVTRVGERVVAAVAIVRIGGESATAHRFVNSVRKLKRSPPRMARGAR